MLEDVLSALDVAHRAAVLHLDIKPANVLLDDVGGFVLTDFGVAQYSRMHRGLLPFSVGTRGYQAPEQKSERFDEYDLRTDLFGLGATAWALATGIHLADREDLMRPGDGDWIYGLPPLSEYRIHCSRQLEETVMSMLRIDPEQRPGSVAEVMARVRAVRERHAVRARERDRPAARRGLGGRRRGADRLARRSALDRDLPPAELPAPLRAVRRRRRALRRGRALLLRVPAAARHRAWWSGTGARSRASPGEGNFLGEVATLMSLPRTATLRAAGAARAVVLNAAELERFVTSNPAMGLRVIRSLARRLSKQPPERQGPRVAAGRAFTAPLFALRDRLAADQVGEATGARARGAPSRRARSTSAGSGFAL